MDTLPLGTFEKYAHLPSETLLETGTPSQEKYHTPYKKFRTVPYYF